MPIIAGFEFILQNVEFTDGITVDQILQYLYSIKADISNNTTRMADIIKNFLTYLIAKSSTSNTRVAFGGIRYPSEPRFGTPCDP